MIYLVSDDRELHPQLARVASQLGARCQTYLAAEQLLSGHVASRPACIVSEFDLLGISGLEFQQSLLNRGRRIPIFFLTPRPDTERTVRAIQQGAVTVLDKPVSDAKLGQVLAHALRQDRQIQRVDSRHHELRRRVSKLTPKEIQVLELMLQGQPNKVIAKRLGVSLRTVEVRRHNIFHKTDTRSVAELVRLVMEIRPSVPLSCLTS